MGIRRRVAAALVGALAIAVPAAADPLTIVSGMIQTYGNGSSFLFQTDNGLEMGGDTEGIGFPPIFLSGQAGDLVNLSSSVNVALTGFAIFDPNRTDLAARAVFDFSAADAVLPDVTSVAAATNGLGLLAAPFTFTGTLFVYPTYAELVAGGPAAREYQLSGTGRADAMLMASQTPDGQPIVSYSAVYTFGEDPAATPEPGTLLLVGSCAAALAARRRINSRG
jgi:hypothetical protein